MGKKPMAIQLSLFPEKKSVDSCYTCKYFEELKNPHKQTDGAVIVVYGYCFHDNGNMEKGYAVFVPESKCKDFRRKKGDTI